MDDFRKFYEALVDEFKTHRLFKEIIGDNKTSFNWPAGSGVYVIWNNTGIEKNVIYVGMTGKFSRNSEGKVVFKGKQFKDRMLRWTPYRFCESKKDGEFQFSFRYGPKFSEVTRQGSSKYEADAYKTNIPYKELIIHCFIINEKNEFYTPASLESIILTKYLKCYKDLPPANNEL